MAHLSTPGPDRGTEFEKPRGISLVDVRDGFARVVVEGLSEPVADSRLAALEAVAAAGLNIDFLKLTPHGLAFLVAEADAEKTRSALARFDPVMQTPLSVVLVHAVNMRDEEGLMARALASAVESGAPIEHVSDMHDRLLIVTDQRSARALCERLAETAR